MKTFQFNLHFNNRNTPHKQSAIYSSSSPYASQRAFFAFDRNFLSSFCIHLFISLARALSLQWSARTNLHACVSLIIFLSRARLSHQIIVVCHHNRRGWLDFYGFPIDARDAGDRIGCERESKRARRRAAENGHE
jgi:hypothetical protein